MDRVWTFHRGSERLVLQRRETDEGHELHVSGTADPRTHHFRDLASLVQFQCDMEEFLLKTGWSFEEFSPDRRKGGDRRGFPRIDNDRRRWWTDGLRLFRIPGLVREAAGKGRRKVERSSE